MDSFTISLAGIPVGIKPISPEIPLYFSNYLSSDPPCFTVAPSEKDLENEQVLSDRRNGKDSSVSPVPAISREWMALLRLIADRIPEYGAILFHGSVVAVDGKAYLFTAPSGTGKTTHTRLWLQQLPQAYVLNGDKPFLKPDAGGRVLVCSSPWRGKEKLGCNEILPLEAICLLERSKENHICSITPRDANRMLLHQIHLPGGNAGLCAIQLLNRISSGVKLFRLGCNMEPEAAQVSIRAMIPDMTEGAGLRADAYT